MSKRPSLSRRQVLQGGLAALAAGITLPAALATRAEPTLPAVTAPPTSLSPGIPRGPDAVARVLSGVGVYVGNDWLNWGEDARRFAMARVRGWGFDFLCPKVGGYGRTWYRDEDHLQRWADSARGIGLGFVPFLYTIPETGAADAKIAAQIARTVGIVSVDMEDEWGPKEAGETPGYKGSEMAEFGRVYRDAAGDRPIIVTGYGDPLTRFGPPATGFPNAEMAAWADAYSPQWYIGVWSKYHKGGVKAALDWGQDECRQALGAGFPICPSIDLSSIYTPDGLFPLPDTLELMAAMRAYGAPVFVWEYNLVTPAHAESLLGPPLVKNVRVGRARPSSLEVIWDTHVPARSIFTYPGPDGIAKTVEGKTLNLTHSGSAGKLTPGAPYPMTVSARSGAGASDVVPLTVATAPATPGVYVLSALAARSVDGHIRIAVTLANSAATEAEDVRVTSLAVEGGSVLAPTALPSALGTLGAYDWATLTGNRATFSVIVDKVARDARTITLRIAGTASGAGGWTATLPLSLPST